MKTNFFIFILHIFLVFGGGNFLEVNKRLSNWDSVTGSESKIVKIGSQQLQRNVHRNSIITVNCEIKFEAISVDDGFPLDTSFFVKMRLSDSEDGLSNFLDSSWKKIICLAGDQFCTVPVENFEFQDFGVNIKPWVHVFASAVSGIHTEDHTFVKYTVQMLTINVETDKNFPTTGPWLTIDNTTDFRHEGLSMQTKNENKFKTCNLKFFSKVYTIKLPNVQMGENIRILSESTISRCNRKDLLGKSNQNFSSPCYNDERNRDDEYLWEPEQEGYYDPTLFGCIYVGGPNDFTVSFESKKELCTYEKHHCTMVLPEATFMAENTGDHWIYLMFAASSLGEGKVKTGHAMEVETGKGYVAALRSQKQFGDVVQSQNSDSSFRFPAFHKPPDATSETFLPTYFRIHAVALSSLTNIILVTGSFTIKLRFKTKTCTPLIVVRVVLEKNVGNVGEKVDLNNVQLLGTMTGQNCPFDSHKCKYEKAAVASRLDMNENENGNSNSVSLIAAAFRTCIDPDKRDEIKVTKSSLQIESIQ